MVSTKRIIVNDINDTLLKLTNKQLGSLSAGNARLVYGERGTGKSSALTLATLASWLVFDNVVPIYLHYAGGAANYQSPGASLSAALGLSPDTPLQNCLEQLNSRGLHALVVVDEIEHVYAGTDHEDKRQRVLSDLQHLVNRTTGSAFTYICSNSAFAPRLLQGERFAHIPILNSDFPLLNNDAPKLDLNKIPELVVHRGQNTAADFIAVREAYGIDQEEGPDDVFTCVGSSLASMERFYGTAYRMVVDAESAGTEVATPEQKEVLNSLLTQSMDRTDARAVRVQQQYGRLIAALDDKLLDENVDTVRTAVLGRHIDWPSNLRPVQASALRELVTAHHPDVEDWRDVIRLLVDTGFFSASPAVTALFPNRPQDFVTAYPEFAKAHLWECMNFMVRLEFQELRDRIAAKFSFKSA
jgi:hypothetical protein